MLQYILFFIIGGLVVAGTKYMCDTGKGGVAALIASVPVLFLVSCYAAYTAGGVDQVVSFSRGMCIGNLPWIMSVIVFALMARYGYPLALDSVVLIVVYLVMAKIVSGFV